MAPASQPPSPVCTHERRPGTTVCVRCRHEARIAAQLRRKRLMLRGGAVGLVLATAVAAGLLSATAMRGKGADRRVAATEPAPAPVESVPPTAAAVSVARPPTVSTPQKDSAAPVRVTVVPMVPPGESPLRDGVTAVRVDSVVTVVFDIPMMHTRQAAKFEGVVRTTLPQIYGPAAEAALAKIPDGGIASQGELLTELPTRGVRIPLVPVSAGIIQLYPETKPGQDGPLVVRYRVTIVPAGL